MAFKFSKEFFTFLTVTVVLYIYRISFTSKDEEFTSNKLTTEYVEHSLKKPGMKYILQWTLSNTIPFISWGYGQDEFIRRRCKVNKCFVTPHKSMINITEFDLVAFHGPEIQPKSKIRRRRVIIPKSKQRSTHQKYVFVSIESSKYYPVCDKKYDGYFNWTWTYKLNSDIPYEYIAVKNINGDRIGPKQNMEWINVDLMEPVNDMLKERLKTKNKTVAWFVSNCHTLSKRENFATYLRHELQYYNLNMDVFGGCAQKSKCPLNEMKDCQKMIEKEYYFYLAFENSFADDYVTEKLLRALQSYAIPIVFGGANYTRFMPNGIYLDGRLLHPRALAKKMADIIKDKERYYSFFKWHNHYSYHSRDESPETDELCKLCEMLHDEELMSKKTVYTEFRKWWNVPGDC